MKKPFYICWVEGARQPPTRKFKTLAEAKECVEYLIGQCKVAKVHIMKSHSICEKEVNYTTKKFGK